LYAFADGCFDLHVSLLRTRGDLVDALDALRAAPRWGLPSVAALDVSISVLHSRSLDLSTSVRAIGRAFADAGGGGTATVVEVDERVIDAALDDADSADQAAQRERGRELAREIRRCMELGNRSWWDRFWGEDGSEALGRALSAADGEVDDPYVAAGLLEELGVEATLDLEEMLDDDDDFSGVVREALSSAGRTPGALPDAFERELVDRASIAQLARLVGDETHAQSTELLTAAGLAVAQRGWHDDWITSGYSAVEIRDVDPHADDILRAVARDDTAAARVLADRAGSFGLLALSEAPAGRDAARAAGEVVEAGTGTGVRRVDPGLHLDALTMFLDVLGDREAWAYDYAGEEDDPSGSAWDWGGPHVVQELAPSIVDMFGHNADLFSDAVHVTSDLADQLDAHDLRTVATAAYQHGETAQAFRDLVSLEVARLLAEGTNYSADDTDRLSRLHAIGSTVGDLVGIVGSVESDVLIGAGAAADERRAAQVSLLTGAFGLGADLAGVEGPAGSVLGFGVDQLSSAVEDILAGTSEEHAREAVTAGYRTEETTLSITLLSAEVDAARAAVEPGADVSETARRNAQALLDAIEARDRATGIGLLGPDGRLADPGALAADPVTAALADDVEVELVRLIETPGVVADVLRPTLTALELERLGSRYDGQ
jgi:hypothetical protein